MAAEAPGHTLDATALVHEAYLRLVGDQQFDGRGHFFAAAAEAMRRILVDHARTRMAAKRGAGRRVKVDLNRVSGRDLDDDVLAVHDAIDRLAAIEPRVAKLVTLRTLVVEPYAKQPRTWASPGEAPTPGGPMRGLGWRPTSPTVEKNPESTARFSGRIRIGRDGPDCRRLPVNELDLFIEALSLTDPAERVRFSTRRAPGSRNFAAGWRSCWPAMPGVAARSTGCRSPRPAG